jgi:type I restriction enzyme S subunit
MSKKKQKSIEELLEEALVPEEEQPYEVPENWVWVNCGAIAEVVRGVSYKKDQVEQFKNTNTSLVIRGGNIQEGKLVNQDDDVYVKNDIINENQRLQEKDVLLVSSTGSNKVIGKAASVTPEFVNESFGAFITLVRPDKKINGDYFGFYFQSSGYKSVISNLAKGSNIKNIKKEHLENLSFPLPPLNEQKRIAEKIERLFAKIDEAKRLIEEVKGAFDLRWESVLDKAFRGELTKKWRSENSMIESADDIFKEIQKVYKKSNKKDEHEINPPYQIPQNWRWVRLGDIVDINPSKKKLADIEDNQSCTFIPMPSVSDKTGEIENPEIREYAEVKKGYTFFLENDILFAKITPCMENGKTAIAKNLINGFGFGSTEFHVIRTNPYINTKLIYYLLRSKKFRMEAKKEMTGAVGQQRVPKSFLENYLFPLPPKAEQDKIVELLDKLYVKEVEISKIETLEGKIDLLRQSILNKAFRGELGTNDPTDEHAIELLKEVLKSK